MHRVLHSLEVLRHTPLPLEQEECSRYREGIDQLEKDLLHYRKLLEKDVKPLKPLPSRRKSMPLAPGALEPLELLGAAPPRPRAPKGPALDARLFR